MGNELSHIENFRASRNDDLSILFANVLSMETIKEATKHNATCDECEKSIYGTRFKCVQCDDYDLCNGCLHRGYHSHHAMVRIATPRTQRPNLFQMKEALREYRLACESGRKIRVTCDVCEEPIAGTRFTCITCDDYDLCEECEQKGCHPMHPLIRIVSKNKSSDSLALFDILELLGSKKRSDDLFSQFFSHTSASSNNRLSSSSESSSSSNGSSSSTDSDKEDDDFDRLNDMFKHIFNNTKSFPGMLRESEMEQRKRYAKQKIHEGDVLRRKVMEEDKRKFENAMEELKRKEKAFQDEMDAKLEETKRYHDDEVRRQQNEQEALLNEAQKIQKEFEDYVNQKPAKPICKTENFIKIVNDARKSLNVDVENFYNFAFAGHVKAGKSSLINSIRGITKFHPDAAPVGVTECTQEITRYTFPDGKFSKVRFYDIPGSGTMTHTSKNYYNDKMLCAFDCLIILVQNTLCEEEVSFARTALEYNQPVVFVRSRCDSDLDSLEKNGDIEERTQEIADKLIEKLGQAYKKEINTRAPELKNIPCFFVSSISLRNLVNGKGSSHNSFCYQEGKFLEYLTLQSKHGRNVVAD